MRLLLLLSFVLVPLVGARSLSAQDVPTLSPGDSVRIVVWRHPEFNGDLVVGPEGTITHPLYRSVRVGGISLDSAEANLRTFLITFEKEPQFSMEPLLRVSVSGQVPRPMVFGAQPGTPLAQAVTRAGGTQEDGDRRHVRVIRTDRNGAQRIFKINLEDPADRMAQLSVRSGDQIIVDPKRSFVRNYLIPALGIVGSIASLGLLIDRVSRER